MSGADEQIWPLAPLDEMIRLSKIERIRNAALPSNKELQRLRERADQVGLDRFEPHDLQLADGTDDEYWLTVGAAGTRVGRVGLRKNAPAYRLLWLVDQRTFELVGDEPETWMLFADGLEIGEIVPIGHQKLLMFRVASEWAVRIGDREILRFKQTQTRSLGTGMDVLVEFADGTRFQAWTGMPKRQSICKYDEPRRALSIPKKQPLTFLPIPSEDITFTPIPELSLALLGLALATRQAYWTTGD